MILLVSDSADEGGFPCLVCKVKRWWGYATEVFRVDFFRGFRVHRNHGFGSASVPPYELAVRTRSTFHDFCLSPSDVLLHLSYIGLAQALNHFGLGYSAYYAPLGYHR